MRVSVLPSRLRGCPAEAEQKEKARTCRKQITAKSEEGHIPDLALHSFASEPFGIFTASRFGKILSKSKTCHRFLIVFVDYVDSHHKHTQWAYPLKSAIYLKGSNGNKCTGKLLLIGWGISHLTALSLSFGRVNHPERAEDESATGDEPSRGAHR